MSASSRGHEKEKPLGRFGVRGRRARREWLAKRLAPFKPFVAYWAVLLLAVALIHLIIRPPSPLDVNRFRLDQPSPRVVTAPFAFDFVDEIETQSLRHTAVAELAAPIYRVQPEARQKLLQRLQAVSDAAKIADPLSSDQPDSEWAADLVTLSGLTLEDRLLDDDNNDLDDSIYRLLARYADDPNFWSAIIESVHDALGLGIANTIAPLRQSERPNEVAERRRVDPGVVLLDPDGRERVTLGRQEIRTYDRFLDIFSDRFSEQFENRPALELALDLVNAAYEGPTLVFDEERTAVYKRRIEETVQPVVVWVEKDETLIGKDEMVTERHLQRLTALRDRMRISPLAEIGFFVLAAIFVFVVLHYLRSCYPAIPCNPQQLAVVFIAIIMLLGLARLADHLSLLDMGSNILRHVGYAVPTGALGVILTVLVSPRLAAFCCALCSMYIGVIMGYAGAESVMPYILVSFITSCGAIYTVTQIRQRSDLYRAGGVAMFLAMIVIFAVDLQGHKNIEMFLLQAESLKFALIWGGVNGALVSILAIALMPIFEDFIGKITDIRLLELSQKNELLQRLEQEAPGTYHHTMRVAALAESASAAVGANALLTRVGCYYHDIGKTVNPQYFVENQQTAADKSKHSRISPNMSCLIIRNHVKHGIELARQYKLPQPIIDFIPEHHGTTLLAYFYHQALASEEAEGKIKEDDFRYPGPKPQSRETAILMLADSLEATSRLLESPNERDVRQLVRKIINERFMDGQFDDCELTLKDLHTLYQTFSESIIHMLHQRIHYPEPPAPRGRILEPSIPSPTADPMDLDAKDTDEPIVAIKEKRHNGKSSSESPNEQPESADAASKKND